MAAATDTTTTTIRRYDDDDISDDDYDDQLNLSDIVRHTGDILKRRGLLLEKESSSSSSPSQCDVALPHHLAIPSSSNVNANRQSQYIARQHSSSNNIHCHDSSANTAHRSTAAQLGSPQQRHSNQQHYSSRQQVMNSNLLSKGRRRALRWISDRAAQDEERRKKELSSPPLSSPPQKLEHSCATTTKTTAAAAAAAAMPPISPEITDLTKHRPASNTQPTMKAIHNEIVKDGKTTPKSYIVQRHRNHHHINHAIVPETASSSAIATTQIQKKAIHDESENSETTTTPKSKAVQYSRFHKSSSSTMATQIQKKALHNEGDNSRTATTPKSNAMQHSHHIDHSRLHELNSSTMATQIQKKAMYKECANGMPTTTPASTSNIVQRPYQPTTVRCHPTTVSSSYNSNTMDPNTERLLRFHEAYNAIIRATTLPNNEGGRNTISARWLQSGAKRWTRDPNIVSAVSIDGRVYEDLQRTPTLSLKQMKGSNGIGMAPTALYDRGASWFTMVTPPKHPHYHPVSSPHTGHTNNHDGEYGKLNGNNGGEEGETAMHLSHLILQGDRNYQQRKVLIRQFSIDCRIPTQQHGDAKRGGHVSISTLHLLFIGGRHAMTSKPKHDRVRRKNLHHRRSTFEKKLQDNGTTTDVRPVNGRRRTFTKKSSNTNSESNAVTAEISIADTKEIVSTVSNLQERVEEETLSIPPPSQDRFNVIDFFKESLLYHLSESSIIDTDGTEIDILEDGNDFYDDTHNNSATTTTTTSSTARIQSMLMSPSLITKRYQQALKAIEHRNWKQISHMINANPWLMEMKDVRNDQNLVHTLAFFGGELNNIGHESSNPTTIDLPEQLVRDIIEYEPSAVHKLDIEGNLPLHMAAASGNVIMIEELGRRFPGAASVQNHYGLLPLHLAVISYQDLLATTTTYTIFSVELLLEMFPGAVGVKDNDGNLPLHTAAAALRGDDGARVVNLLLKAYHDWSMTTARVDSNPPPAVVGMCKNNAGETPLTRAIQSLAGKDMIEALLHGDGGRLAALDKGSESRNALHLALDRNFHDASVVLSILKASPSTATIVDGNGMLPIQLACRNSLQHEVILAISIIDLPIDLGAMNGAAVLREGFGASWWYLLCESNDEYVSVVHDILSLCSYPQKVALCLAKKVGGNDDNGYCRSMTVVSCATPRCEQELRKRCLFWNRFEIVGEATTKSHAWNMQMFDAIDYGGTEYDDPIAPNGGKRVSLFCYTDSKAYRKDVDHLILHNRTLDSKQFEELNHLAKERDDDHVDDVGDDLPPYDVSSHYCVATEAPRKTLANVIAQMANYDRMKYLHKSRHLLHGISKSLHTMHTNNIIHGCIDSSTIGKFGSTTWKITGLIGSVVAGGHFPASRLGLHSPPEAFVVMRDKIDHERKFASVAQSLVAEPTVDVWAFGKLLYEVLAGESLFRLFLQKKMQNNKYHHEDASKCILKWSDDRHLLKVTKKLLSMGTSANGVELISKCLCGKHARAKSMEEIVDHPFWDGF